MAKQKTTSRYAEAKPKQFGNMHERMKYLIAAATEDEAAVPQDVWHAICDLQTEVEGHTPIEPSFGPRRDKIGAD